MGVQRWELEQGARRQPLPDGPVASVVIAADARCATGLIEVRVAPGSAMPEHDHGASEVMLIMRSGRARLVAVGDGSVTELDPGVVVTIPIGERVRLENPSSSEARLLVVLTPPDFAAAVQAWPEASHDDDH